MKKKDNFITVEEFCIKHGVTQELVHTTLHNRKDLANKVSKKDDKSGRIYINTNYLECRAKFTDRVKEETQELFFYFTESFTVWSLAEATAHYWGRGDDELFIKSMHNFLAQNLFFLKTDDSIFTKQVVPKRLWYIYRAFRAMFLKFIHLRHNKIAFLKENCKLSRLKKKKSLYQFYLEYILDKRAGLI